MNKVYVLPPGEQWIVDRFVSEWNEDNADISVTNPNDADVIWLLADWCWNQLPAQLLQDKKVITTVHHIVPDKFYHSRSALADFQARDQITDLYHVYNKRAEEFIRPLTQKPICIIEYWANDSIFKLTKDLNHVEGIKPTMQRIFRI